MLQNGERERLGVPAGYVCPIDRWLQVVEDPQSSQQVVPGSLLISLQSPLGGSEEAAATLTSLEWRKDCEQEQGMFGTLYNQHY